MNDTNANVRPRRWGRVVLIVSLALNLAVVGVVAGTAFHFGKRGHRAHSDNFAAPYIRALDHLDRMSIREKLHRGPDMMQADQAARRETYNQMADALRAEPFDPDRIHTLMMQQREGVRSRISAAQDVWLRHVSEMSTQARADYADRLEEVVEQRSRRLRGN